ncbi:MAG: magnesium chelatase subunit D [Pseudomonadota bacterium]
MTKAPDSAAIRWKEALLALKLLALEPRLGGIALRARAGPVRERWLSAAARLPQPQRKVPHTVTSEDLNGGLDIAATLAAGHEIRSKGILATEGMLVLPMAERLEAGLAACLSQALDIGRHVLLALDEGVDERETLSPALADRLAFHLDLDGIACGDAAAGFGTLPDPEEVSAGEPQIAAIAALAESLGVESARAALFCLWAARAHAALHRARVVRTEDIEAAAKLVLVPRATRIPEPAEPQPEEPERPDRDDTEPDAHEGQGEAIPQDILLDAVRAALPADILSQLARKHRPRGAKGTGKGAKTQGNRRGRPLAPRPGKADGRARLDIVATLRAAAPWQTLRKAHSKRDRLVEIRSADFRVKRYEEKSDSLLVFAVDASGSAALARLSEAKGAIEILLAEAYARRDHVALVGFRGIAAEVLLPPTRSLVQTKRRLAALPGGGGTPLAAGLKSAGQLALQGRGRGMSPTIILLTDGRANVALDGEADRARAAADAIKQARVILNERLEVLVIDVGKRPERALRTLAETMDATYLPLPRANAERVSEAVSTLVA